MSTVECGNSLISRVGAHARQADLTDEDQVRLLFASIKNDLGRIDVLCNNAGLNDRNDHPALDMPLPVWERVLAANLTTTFLCCKHVVPHLLDNDPPGGSIINTASFLAVMPMGRFGTPDELAGTVAYLASEDSGFIVGAVFPLDGGITSAFTVPE
jgi:NAD(P)-dependent dehydrogenase (short-subunit alcohol dehydrogenase family)